MLSNDPAYLRALHILARLVLEDLFPEEFAKPEPEPAHECAYLSMRQE